MTYREPGKDGYFLLMLSPKDDVAERELVNKDIVFVLDTSGSMADEGKMDKAKKALLFGIKTLRDGDRFNVINFAGEEHLMERGLIAADAAGQEARRGIRQQTPADRRHEYQRFADRVAKAIRKRRPAKDARVYDRRTADSRRDKCRADHRKS